MSKTIKDVPPTIDGLARAWRCDLAEVRTARNNPEDAQVATWIVSAPWANPMWANYLISVVHLRDIPGQTRPPIIHRENASHEIMVMALNDDHVPPLNLGVIHCLTPPNYVGQLAGLTDEEAGAQVESAIKDICAGTLSPDTDHVRAWKVRFGDHCFKKYAPGSLDQFVSDGGTTIADLETGEPLIVIPGHPAPSDGETKH